MIRTTRRSLGLLASSAIIGTVSNGAIAHADASQASDVVVFCEPTLQAAIGSVAGAWRARIKVPVRIFVAPSDLLLEQVARGARCDLLVVAGDNMAEAATRRGLIRAESRFKAWRNRLVIATHGTPGPSVSLIRGSNVAGLLGKGRLAVADSTISDAGAKSRAVLETLGLWTGLEGRLLGAESTTGVVFLLSTKKAALGVVYATDVAASPRLSVAATFPDDSYPETTYTVALTKSDATPESPRFWELLRGTEARAPLKASGLEWLS